ncbi:MAG: PAS domain S-box protein [Anaerolineaceae bacterium]|nr:PAS domain S-box protein [Anaerolineaceae bacterium]MCB9101856.1 PAS domain S-box protein [Anaerolineales bacterium]
MGTIIQASQAISREMEIGGLLEKFVKIILHQTSAHMAMVLLEQQGQWVIAATGQADQDRIEVLQAKSIEDHLPVSAAFVERVIRTKEKVVYSKGLSSSASASQNEPSRSNDFVIYPLLADHELKGMVYLESWPAWRAEVFEVLHILTSQAALSLENAKVYQRLKDEVVEAKKTEESLKNSEARYRHLIELSFDSIAIHIDRKFVYINSAGAKLYGARCPKELIGRSIYDFVHPDDLDVVKPRIQRIETEGISISLTEQKLVRTDGQVITVEVAAVPIIYEGQPAIQAIIRDITPRKRDEAALIASETKFRTLTETTLSAVFIFQGDRNRYVNRYAQVITGYTEAELLAMNFWDIIHPEQRELVRERGLTRQQGQPVQNRYEIKILTKGGSPRWIEAALGIIEFEGKPAVLGTSFDITTRKKIEAEREQLLESERNQRLISDTLGQVFLALASHIRLEEVLDEILVQIRRTIAYDAANVALLDHQKTLHIVHWQGYEKYGNEETIARLAQQASDFPLDATIIRTHQPVIITDTYKHPQWIFIEELHWIRSFVGLPLYVGERILGILRLVGDSPGRFSVKDLKYLQPIAQAAAIAIENARLYEQVQRDLADLTQTEQALIKTNQQLLALQHAGATLAISLDSQHVLDTVSIELTNLVGGQGCIIYGWNSQANTISIAASYNVAPDRLMSYGEHWLDDYPLIKQVLISRRAEQINIDQDQLTDSNLTYLRALSAKAVLVLAMEFQDDLFGAVVLIEQKSARTFDYEEIALAQFLANQAATALENARLFEKTKQEMAERQQAEAALKESETNLRAIFDNSLQAFILIDLDHIIRAINKTAQYGLRLVTKNTVIVGDNFFDIVPPGDLDEICQGFDRALLGESAVHEYKIKLREIDYWVECHYDPVLDEDNQIIGVCFSSIDVSERKKAAQTIVANEARLREEMQILLQNTQALVSHFNSAELLESIVNRAKNLMQANGSVVILLGQDGRQLETITPKQFDISKYDSRQLLSPGSLIEKALTSREVQISDLGYTAYQMRTLQTLLQLPDTSTLVCTPLVIHNTNLGVLLLWRDDPFTDHELHMTSAFASQAALGLENARLYHHNQQLAIQQERHHLARGLHDSVTQSIYSMGLAAETALKFLGDAPDNKIRQPIEYIRGLSKTALTEMREHLYRLHPAPLHEKDVVLALREHCAQLANQHELEIDFQADLSAALTLDQQDGLYYMAREALWNVIKHAEAHRVEITLTQDTNDITLSIADDGIGFELAALNQNETMGLRSIYERADLLNGYAIPQSKPGYGTRLVITIPFEPE